MKIFKYQLELTDYQRITVSYNFQVLSVQTQNNIPCVWIMTDPDAEYTQVLAFYIRGTGHELSKEVENAAFLGTIQQPPFVWHVFCRLSK